MAYKLIPGTDLASRFPAVAEEWDMEANYPLTPKQVASQSNKKVGWICKKGHRWMAVIALRSKGSGCPYCAGRLPIVGETDLATVNPTLAEEWDMKANYPLTPDKVTSQSHKKVGWICKQGHRWNAIVANRTKVSGCPYCAGQLPIVGETDLATVNPTLAQEWDVEANYPLTPEQVTSQSNKKVGWACKKRHHWMAVVAVRSKGSGCPYCAGQLPIAGETDLATVNPTLAKEWDMEANYPLTPEQVTISSGKKVGWICNQGHRWTSKIYGRFNGHGCPYCAGRLPIVGKTDLATVNPTLAQEWDVEANYPLTPEQITSQSNKKVGWVCKQGHRWMAVVTNRSSGNGCPYCAGQLPIVGETDLATVNPTLAREWDMEANYPLTPERVTLRSNKKVGWICKHGHRWTAEINNRFKGCGCPYCAGRLPIIGETDLATVNPTLAQEWDMKANYPLTPEQITVSSGKKVGWICNQGHHWKAKIADRSRGIGCPYCRYIKE